MDEKNVTRISVVRLLGFQTLQNVKFLIFFLILVIYCVTICGNLLIITLVVYSKTLHSPMYFFLCHLSVSDILVVTDIVPNMLHTMIDDNTLIRMSGCIAQFYFFAALEMLECLLLTVMSYDRYLAICKPLHYTSLMSLRICLILVITSWSLSFLTVMVYIITMSKLQFCGPNVIDHYFCDLDPILQLSCSDISIVQLETTSINVMFAMIPCLIVLVSYTYIIITILKIPSITGRQKAFSTCSSHLTVVSIFYGTIVCVYLVPSKGQSWNVTKFLSLLYTVVTPLLNPIIYSLRNKELKQVVGKTIKTFLCMQ